MAPRQSRQDSAPRTEVRPDGMASTEGASPGPGPAQARPSETVSGIFVANSTFATEIDGVQVIVHKGHTRVREGHELLARAGSCFDPVDLEVHYDVEQATKAPGEKRG